MKLRIMHLIDYWVGIPLCFLLTLYLKFLPRSTKTETKKILLIELSEMGSAFLAMPMMQRIKNAHKDCALWFMIFTRNRESVDLLAVLPRDHVIEIDDRSLCGFLWSACRAILRMRNIGFDCVVDLELFSRCTALLSGLSGARQRVGFAQNDAEGLYRGGIFTHDVVFNPHLHITQNFMMLAEAINRPAASPTFIKEALDLPTSLPQVVVKPALLENFARKIETSIGKRSLILLNPDPGLLELRGWPVGSYQEFARLVVTNSEMAVGVMGLERCSGMAQEILGYLPAERAVNLTGMTANLEELVALLKCTKLLVTGDSGPAHIASLVALPTVTLFGPETPQLYRPIGPHSRAISLNLGCSPCYRAHNHRRSSCTDNQCLKQITPALIWRHAQELLQ